MSSFARLCLCVFALVATSLSGLATNRILYLRIGPTGANLYISNANGSGEHRLTKSDSRSSVSKSVDLGCRTELVEVPESVIDAPGS